MYPQKMPLFLSPTPKREAVNVDLPGKDPCNSKLVQRRGVLTTKPKRERQRSDGGKGGSRRTGGVREGGEEGSGGGGGA